MGFLPREQKRRKNHSPCSLSTPGRKGVCVFLPHGQRSFYVRVKNHFKKTVTPEVLSVCQLLLGLSACQCLGELPLLFLLSNLLYSITTHCFYYVFCADDTPLFSKRCAPPTTNWIVFCYRLLLFRIHLSGVIFFFFSFFLGDILVNESRPQLERKSQPCMAILNTWQSQSRVMLFMRIWNWGWNICVLSWV